MPAETHIDRGPLDRQGVFELIRDQLADILETDPATITEGASFAEDLEADSLALIELVEALEEELGERSVGFRIDDEDLEDLRTVRDAVDYVVRQARSRLTGGTVDEGRPRGRRRWPLGWATASPTGAAAPGLAHRSWCGEQDGDAVERAAGVPGGRGAGPGGGGAQLRPVPGLRRRDAGQGARRGRQRPGPGRGGRGARHRRGAAARARARRPRAGAPRRRSWPTPWRRSSARSTSTPAGRRRATGAAAAGRADRAGGSRAGRLRPQEPAPGADGPPGRGHAALRGAGVGPRPRPPLRGRGLRRRRPAGGRRGTSKKDAEQEAAGSAWRELHDD